MTPFQRHLYSSSAIVGSRTVDPGAVYFGAAQHKARLEREAAAASAGTPSALDILDTVKFTVTAPAA